MLKRPRLPPIIHAKAGEVGMQIDNKLLDDLARMASGAVGALSGLRGEVESQFRQQFERILGQMNVVSREEFETVRAMAQAAREQQEATAERAARAAELEERVTRLEALVATLTADRELSHVEAPPKRTPRKAAAS
jgi:BMFP domain-containing protein YqiC